MMPRADNPRHLPAALWPLIGIVLLLLTNIALEFGAGQRLFSPGSFLHVSFQGGAPAGASIDILNYGATFVILAMGMAPVIATRGVDLSVGSIMAISGAVAATLVTNGTNSILAIAAALGIAALCGVWNALLISVLGLQPFIATLVLMVAGRGIAQMITHSQITTFHDPLIEYLGLGRPGFLPLPFPFLMALAFVIGTVLVMRKTALGLLLEAVGGNPEASRLAGVRSKLIISSTYIYSGVCAGVAGLIAAANIKAADPFHAGQNLELAAIFAVVVGGTSLAGGRMNLLGAAVGGLLMQCLITTMYARNIGSDIAPLPQAAVIIAVCIIGAPTFRDMLRKRRIA